MGSGFMPPATATRPAEHSHGPAARAVSAVSSEQGPEAAGRTAACLGSLCAAVPLVFHAEQHRLPATGDIRSPMTDRLFAGALWAAPAIDNESDGVRTSY